MSYDLISFLGTTFQEMARSRESMQSAMGPSPGMGLRYPMIIMLEPNASGQHCEPKLLHKYQAGTNLWRPVYNRSRTSHPKRTPYRLFQGFSQEAT